MANPYRGFKLQEDDYEWLNNEYPNFSHFMQQYFRRNEDNVLADASPGIPAICTVCQFPLNSLIRIIRLKLWTQYSEYNNKTYMTCSPGCKHIFDNEPEKYEQIWWPAEAYLSGEFGEDPVAGNV